VLSSTLLDVFDFSELKSCVEIWRTQPCFSSQQVGVSTYVVRSLVPALRSKQEGLRRCSPPRYACLLCMISISDCPDELLKLWFVNERYLHIYIRQMALAVTSACWLLQITRSCWIDVDSNLTRPLWAYQPGADPGWVSRVSGHLPFLIRVPFFEKNLFFKTVVSWRRSKITYTNICVRSTYTQIY